MAEFIPGIKLCGQFYEQVVRPTLDKHIPNLPHAAALVGSGSEILGFDTPMSSDHHWGPRVQLFLPESHIHHADAISDVLSDVLSKELPHTFKG